MADIIVRSIIITKGTGEVTMDTECSTMDEAFSVADSLKPTVDPKKGKIVIISDDEEIRVWPPVSSEAEFSSMVIRAPASKSYRMTIPAHVPRLMDIGLGFRLNFVIEPEGVDSPSSAEFNASLLRTGTVWRVTIPCKIATSLGLDAGSKVHVKASKASVEESRHAEFSGLAVRMNNAWWVKIPAKAAKTMELKPKERLSVKVVVENEPNGLSSADELDQD